MDDSNNLTITVAQADGTNKSGSVVLPGGAVKIENYNIPLSEVFNRTVVFNTSISLDTSGSSSDTYYIPKITNNGVGDSGIYYDSDECCIKICTDADLTLTSGGTVTMSKYWVSTNTNVSKYPAIADAFSFLIGMKVYSKRGVGYSYPKIMYKLGTNFVIEITVSLTDCVITELRSFGFHSTSAGTKTLSGTMTATLLIETLILEGSTLEALIPVNNIIPSTYKEIAFVSTD